MSKFHEEYRCHYKQNDEGYTFDEARRKKDAVDEAHHVFAPDSKWCPAQIVRDPYMKLGYMVTLDSKV